MSEATQGSLFSNDFLRESIAALEDWRLFAESHLEALEDQFQAIFDGFPVTQTPNESQTEDDLIWPILQCLGWTASLRQQNLAPRGREDVPDGLLFADDSAKLRANEFPEEWKRYGFGLAIVESKRWLRPLDRRSGRRGEETAPSTQMLRYLRRVDDLTAGRLRWGILSKCARWRLYYQGARSVSEHFFEIDLAAILDIPGHNEGLFALSREDRLHWLKVFALIFRREAFLPSPSDERTFHQRALEEGKFYEERVAESLSNLVFGDVFPRLASAIAAAAPDAPLQEVREATLVLLYRLLFILYAEDRDLLPVRDGRYDEYGLRRRVRGDIGSRKDRHDVFSETAARYWSAFDDLCRAIADGDASIGLPPYNGGLFDAEATPILASIRLGDRVMADVIDALSFERTDEGRRYINYRDLSVQQLGSIYERLLEHEIVRDGDDIAVRPNPFARKASGSYYTPDDLVGLILKETIEPLVQSRLDAFTDRAAELSRDRVDEGRRIGKLKLLDPAEKLLDLKICDPAMGSGHFLVNLVDYLADQVIAAMAEAEVIVESGEYVSPLSERIERIRNTILSNAEERGWTIDEEQLDDRHIIRRMILKRCVYGVDKNPMAVELAKVALWLHTFTVGAPLSFLDHHLRCGDSLFGSWVRKGIDRATHWGGALLLHEPVTRAMRAATSMQIIENLTDAEIAEAHRSANVFDEVQEMTAPLNAFLSLIHAFDWLDIKEEADKVAVRAFFDGQFGDPVQIALGDVEMKNGRAEAARFAELFAEAQRLVAQQHFLNWQVTFPGVWSKWESTELSGGFDAVIGNPPWDRLKLQRVEWFAARRKEIAQAQHAADRKRMIAALEESNDPLAKDFAEASQIAEAASRVARMAGDYPLLSGGDTNVNSLFVERAAQICKPDGIVGLLVPSGIATETGSHKFFEKLLVNDSAKCIFDFFNKRENGDLFFPDVYYRFKFCAFVFSPSLGTFGGCRFAMFIRNVDDIGKDERTFTLSLDHIRRVNPNTHTTPVYRALRDKTLSESIYGRVPILVDRSDSEQKKVWPVKYIRMYDMANDSHRFRTKHELLEIECAYPVGPNVWRSADGSWVPLYEGKMVQAYDHRASSIVIIEKNLHRPGQGAETSELEHKNPAFVCEPRYFVRPENPLATQIAIKDITSTTNARSIISCILPPYGAGHTLPIIEIEIAEEGQRAAAQALLCANFNAMILDFVARTKILSNHASWYILEQLPVIPPEIYGSVQFGPRLASEIVREAVLELTYTSHDLERFAVAMGYVGDSGSVKPPFNWDEERRLHLRSKLDAVYFHLYGVTDRDDIRYIYSTFPIIERDETARYGSYRSRDLCLAYMSALAAGDPDAEIRL